MKQLIINHNAGDLGNDYIPSLGILQNRLLKRDMKAVTHLIFHTTGIGVYRREAKLRALNVAAGMLEVVAWTYQNIMPDSGHFVIGNHGYAIQTVPVSYKALHVGANKSSSYTQVSPRNLPDWWWHSGSTGFVRGLDCLHSAWRTKSCNEVSIGVELVMPRTITEALPTAQLNGAKLLADKIRELIPSIEYVTTHSHVHPLARTVKGLPYDLTEHHHAQLKSVISELV